MPRTVSAIEAANIIRERVIGDRMSKLDPAALHGVNFVKEVVHHLGLHATPETVAHITGILHDSDIALHAGHQYPKFVKRGYDGVDVVVNDEQEEKEALEAKAPAASEPAPVPEGGLYLGLDPSSETPVGGADTSGDPNDLYKLDHSVDQGDANQSVEPAFEDTDPYPENTEPIHESKPVDLDLSDKVPAVKPAEHPAGRAPDAVTNRSASQGQPRKRPS